MKTKIGCYQTIFEQLGGGRFLAMTGSKVSGGYNEEGFAQLNIKLKNNKLRAQFMIITLNCDDLYDIEFAKIKRRQCPEYKKMGVKYFIEEYEVIKELKDVYFDMLEGIFEEETGLYVSLF